MGINDKLLPSFVPLRFGEVGILISSKMSTNTFHYSSSVKPICFNIEVEYPFVNTNVLLLLIFGCLKIGVDEEGVSPSSSTMLA